jgi:hypothetical protein
LNDEQCDKCSECGSYPCQCNTTKVKLLAKDTRALMSQMAGYQIRDLDYKASSISPYELASQMRATAEKQGLNFQ